MDHRSQHTTGVLVGVGVGPGDPELLTLKAVRALQTADIICFLKTLTGRTQARDIATAAVKDLTLKAEWMPIGLPEMSDRSLLEPVYDRASADIKQYIASGKKVVFLCEGDPLFFGSFTYLLARLAGKVPIDVIPGISSMHAASAALQTPLALMKENCLILSGDETLDQLVQYLEQQDTLVLMKAGSARGKILSALAISGRTADASYIAYIGRDQQVIVRDCTQLLTEPGPYFSLFLVTKPGPNRIEV